jgi:hypothetical protein
MTTTPHDLDAIAATSTPSSGPCWPSSATTGQTAVGERTGLYGRRRASSAGAAGHPCGGDASPASRDRPAGPHRTRAPSRVRVEDPYDAEGLATCASTTTARLGRRTGRPAAPDRSLLLFQADHGVTQDAIYGTVDRGGQGRVRPVHRHDPGGRSRGVPAAPRPRATAVGRGEADRSPSGAPKPAGADRRRRRAVAAAIDNNLAKILPVIEQGLKSAKISLGTPFFVENAASG